MSAIDPTFCQACGTRVETRTVEGRERAYCPDCEEMRWRVSVPTTSVAVLDGEEVLLIERTGGRDAGRWDLPAGHPEFDEPAPAAAARELHEETGLSVDPDALVPVGTTLLVGEGLSYRSIDFRVDRAATEGSLDPGSDAADARFVTPAAVRAGDVDVRELGRMRLRGAGVLE
jgi:8-oxo-dGTP diphosphatase